MMTSEKGKWRQEISDYDILFIKAGWLVNQNNRPLLFVNQESNGGGLGRNLFSSHMTRKVKNTPWQIGLE